MIVDNPAEYRLLKFARSKTRGASHDVLRLAMFTKNKSPLSGSFIRAHSSRVAARQCSAANCSRPARASTRASAARRTA